MENNPNNPNNPTDPMMQQNMQQPSGNPAMQQPSGNPAMQQPSQPQEKKSNKKIIIIIILIIIFGFIALFLLLSTVAFIGLNSAENNADNARKIAQLRSLELASVQYKSTNGYFPSVAGASNGECVPLSAIEASLSPSLPTLDFTHPDYFYCVNTGIDPTAYVFGVKGISSDNAVLESDVDGNAGSKLLITGVDSRTQCGITSDDTVYCLEGGDPRNTVNNNQALEFNEGEFNAFTN